MCGGSYMSGRVVGILQHAEGRAGEVVTEERKGPLARVKGNATLIYINGIRNDD